MDSEDLLVEVEDGLAVITINRPKVHNALNGEVLQRLAGTIRELGASGSVRAIILTGAGSRSFSAGADLDELAELDAGAAQRVLTAGQQAMQSIEAAEVPVIAAVNGLALGGGFELVLCCTFPVLSTRASLGLPESGLGLIPGYGGTQRLPRLVGRSVAAYLMLSGERLGAARAYELGLTPLEPVEPGQLLAAAKEVAAKLAAKGPQANGTILRAMQTGRPRSAELALESGLAAISVAGDEAREGIEAFKARRPARFGAQAEMATR